MTKQLVSIIIINWNGKEYLKTCLKSIFQSKTKYPYEIIIVDNGSSDGSVEYIKNIKSKIKNLVLIKNKNNLGFAEANNQGFAKAKGDFILFINNDTQVSSLFLDSLIDALKKDPKVAGVQPKIVDMKDHSVLDSSGSFFTSTGILFHRGHKQKAGNSKFNQEGEIFSMKGACMLFRADVLRKVGMFDEDYFAYFEETDLCHRIWLAGFKILYVPKSVIYHKGGGSTNMVGQSFIQYHSFKNRISSYLTNFEFGTLIWLLPFHVLLCFFASIGFIATGKIKHFLSVYKALFWDMAHLKKILNKRSFVQKNIRVIKDSNYLSRISKKVKPVYFWYLLVGGLEKYE